MYRCNRKSTTATLCPILINLNSSTQIKEQVHGRFVGDVLSRLSRVPAQPGRFWGGVTESPALMVGPLHRAITT